MPRRLEIPYGDTAKGKAKDWLDNYKKIYNTDANTQAIIGYNAVMTFAHLCQQGGQGSDRPEVAGRAGVRRQFPGHLQLAADEVLEDRPSRHHRLPGAAGQGRPLGAGEGQSDVLMVRSSALTVHPLPLRERLASRERSRVRGLHPHEWSVRVERTPHPARTMCAPPSPTRGEGESTPRGEPTTPHPPCPNSPARARLPGSASRRRL